MGLYSRYERKVCAAMVRKVSHCTACSHCAECDKANRCTSAYGRYLALARACAAAAQSILREMLDSRIRLYIRTASTEQIEQGAYAVLGFKLVKGTSEKLICRIPLEFEMDTSQMVEKVYFEYKKGNIK